LEDIRSIEINIDYGILSRLGEKVSHPIIYLVVKKNTQNKIGNSAVLKKM
jgi:hypothetical protein